jgi:hypothetical protein
MSIGIGRLPPGLHDLDAASELLAVWVAGIDDAVGVEQHSRHRARG